MVTTKLLIFVGQYLKNEEFCSWSDIQKFVAEEENNLPKEEIENLLETMVLDRHLAREGYEKIPPCN
jgi:hypothetical protein